MTLGCRQSAQIQAYHYDPVGRPMKIAGPSASPWTVLLRNPYPPDVTGALITGNALPNRWGTQV